MKKNVFLALIFFIIQVICVLAIKGFSYPLLPILVMLGILSYISIVDWKTGLINVGLNVAVFALAVLGGMLGTMDWKTIGINLLIFVLPFIILEAMFQIFGNKEKDEDKFLIGGGDIILFATMSMLLAPFEMMIMLFFASLGSLIASKIIKKSMVHFAPFIQFGFLIAFLFGAHMLSFWQSFIIK